MFDGQFALPSPFSEAWGHVVPTTGVMRALTSAVTLLRSPSSAHGMGVL